MKDIEYYHDASFDFNNTTKIISLDDIVSPPIEAYLPLPTEDYEEEVLVDYYDTPLVTYRWEETL
jgi:hypothetical protein